MHGNPTSRYDNKLIWKKYDYRNFGILIEPYLDVDWNEFGYLTDTGRKWNSKLTNVRDKVNSKFKLNFRSTYDVLNNIDKVPYKLAITLHPERWTDNYLDWSIQFMNQNIKNLLKTIVLKYRNGN